MNKLTILDELLRRIRTGEIEFENPAEVEQHLVDIRRLTYEEIKKGYVENGQDSWSEIEKEYGFSQISPATFFRNYKKMIDLNHKCGGYSWEYICNALDRGKLIKNYGRTWSLVPQEVKDYYRAMGYMNASVLMSFREPSEMNIQKLECLSLKMEQDIAAIRNVISCFRESMCPPQNEN